MPRDPPQFIAARDELIGLIDELRRAGSFAYDSEFIREQTYFPRLCLIAVATTQRVALIDPLAELDLRPFWELIADPHVEKILHAGYQDLEPVVRVLDQPPANIFDTQIASGFAAMPYPLGLRKLVAQMMSAPMGSALTFTRWDRRPLSELHQRYAADDVRYLIAIRHELESRLRALGHVQAAREQCASLGETSLYRFDPDTQYRRVRKAKALGPRELALLRELVQVRDQAARQRDLPPRTVLKDEVLIRLARQPVKKHEALFRVRGLPRSVAENYGQSILDATQRGLTTPPEQRPAKLKTEEPPDMRFHVDGLWAAVQSYCFGRGIDPALVSSREEMAQVYRAFASEENPENLGVMRGWRGNLVGGVIRDLLGQSAEIELQWRGERLAARSISGAREADGEGEDPTESHREG